MLNHHSSGFWKQSIHLYRLYLIFLECLRISANFVRATATFDGVCYQCQSWCLVEILRCLVVCCFITMKMLDIMIGFKCWMILIRYLPTVIKSWFSKMSIKATNTVSIEAINWTLLNHQVRGTQPLGFPLTLSWNNRKIMENQEFQKIRLRFLQALRCLSPVYRASLGVSDYKPITKGLRYLKWRYCTL